MEEEQEQLQRTIRGLEKQVEEKKAELELEKERKAEEVTVGIPKETVADEVKRVMNQMYHSFRQTFDDENQLWRRGGYVNDHEDNQGNNP